MTAHSSQSPEDRFNAYLDALASGRSTPDASDLFAGSYADSSMPVDAARELHDLAKSAEARRGDLPDQIWETIMGSSPLVNRAGTSPSSPRLQSVDRAEPPGGAAELAPRTTRRLRLQSSRLPWMTIANVALAIALVVIGFGGYRLLQDTADTSPIPTPSVGGLAINASSVVSTPDLTATVPPAAMTVPATRCDLSNDIPIFRGESSDWSGTSLVLTWDGELRVSCPGEDEPTPLATGVEAVLPMDWPGTLRLHLDDGGVNVLSLRANRSLELGSMDLFEIRESNYLNQVGGYFNLFNQEAGSPWLVTPATSDLTDWRITDLRTLESRFLSDYTGTVLDHSRAVMLSANGIDSTGVVTVLTAYDEDSHALNDSRLPGTSLVLRGTLDETSWITAHPEADPVADVLLAPDGRHLATKQLSADGNAQITISRVDSGDSVVRTAPYQNTGPMQMTWVQDGEAVAYLDQAALKVLPAQPDTTADTIFRIDGGNLPSRLRPTPDTDIVLLWGDSGDVTTVDTVTGETIFLPGFDRGSYSGLYRDMPPARFLVTSLATEDDPDLLRFQIVDTVAGGVVFDVPQVRVSTWEPQAHRIESTSSGDVMVVVFDDEHTYLVDARDGSPAVSAVEVPDELAELEGFLIPHLSPDGTLLMLGNSESNTGLVTRLEDQTSTWSQVLLANHPAFVTGIGG